jgi:hypothetical protein
MGKKSEDVEPDEAARRMELVQDLSGLSGEELARRLGGEAGVRLLLEGSAEERLRQMVRLSDGADAVPGAAAGPGAAGPGAAAAEAQGGGGGGAGPMAARLQEMSRRLMAAAAQLAARTPEPPPAGAPAASARRRRRRGGR